MAIIKFTNGLLCDEGHLKAGDLYVDTYTGKIVAPKAQERVDKTIDLMGLILAPGFIDIQINGCFGFNYTDYESDWAYEQGYDECMKKLLTTGTTSVCPTIVTSTPRNYTKILPKLKHRREKYRTESLGSHCEGPMISTKKKGCHNINNLKRPKSKKEFYDVYGGKQNLENIKIITAAPELDGILDIIPEIVANDVVYAVGHTEAKFETALKAVDHGATMITHTFNAMPQPHHRDPGPIGLLGLSDSSKAPFYGLISDGIHVNPTYVKLAYDVNKDKVCLVTDATFAMGLPDGDYVWENAVQCKRGAVLKLKGTDTIAGSVATLAYCVRNAMKWCNIPLAEAVKCVTNNPARSVGLQVG
ncbi:unnamed protein product [Ambrosiozyma monospora]|uniref:Unnamed protein product n=1 Tax=Ambrosiozyma monospora TaxID=43982 RepID=A0ACB5T6V5_AMBMO|nr:unnamed protein product [Ambrosiozyma monospora]